MTHNIFF